MRDGICTSSPLRVSLRISHSSSFEVQESGLLPEAMAMDSRLLYVIDGSYFHPKVRRQEVVWMYFESLRKANAAVPEAIPVDKKVFLENTRQFMSQIRSYKPREVRNPTGESKPSP